MSLKSLAIYFVFLFAILFFLFGLMRWRGNDIEFRYYTAIRMHACDIVKNDRSTLPVFNPDRCEVRRRPLWVGQMIDVDCAADDIAGNEHHFSYTYSDSHEIFNYLFELVYLKTHGGYCHG